MRPGRKWTAVTENAGEPIAMQMIDPVHGADFRVIMLDEGRGVEEVASHLVC